MPFRTIIIKSRAKLEYSLNYLVYRTENLEKRILLDEINTIIIESTQVAITTALISSLAEKNIKLIFCDSKFNPQCEILTYHGTYDMYDKLNEQFNISKLSKDKVWSEIVIKKILYQSKLLMKFSKESAELLENYAQDVLLGDSTNREGFAAKVYFNRLFGTDFNRNQDCEINMFLDYGYTVILSSFNRIIKMLGYYTELGIHHIGRTNPFNFSCDLMEPIRPLIDCYVVNKIVDKDNFRDIFVSILDSKVKINDSEMYLENAIRVYVNSVINSLKSDGKVSISFIEYEL
jgi:CRISPR-associated endonuclease Cas1